MGKKLFILTALYILLVNTSKVEAYNKEAGNAAQLNINAVGSKTETVDQRVVKITALLHKHKSPLVNYAETFVKEADEHNLDWRLVAAIAGLESSYGKRIPFNSYNAWGWGIPTGALSGIGFTDWEHGIATVSEGLEKKYVKRGLDTPEKMGPVYAASPTWAVRVRFIMNQLEEVHIVDNKLIAMNW